MSQKKPDISIKQFFWFPIKLLPYFLLVMITNVLVCEFVRNVDPPLTDYWSLSVNDELVIGAIDTSDKWSLWPNRGGEAIISNIVLAGIDDKGFYGSTEAEGYFIYRFQSKQKRLNLSRDTFELEINELVPNLPKLKHPSELYYDNRNFGDLITFLLILIYPLYRFYKMCSAFWLTLSRQDKLLVSES